MHGQENPVPAMYCYYHPEDPGAAPEDPVRGQEDPGPVMSDYHHPEDPVRGQVNPRRFPFFGRRARLRI